MRIVFAPTARLSAATTALRKRHRGQKLLRPTEDRFEKLRGAKGVSRDISRLLGPSCSDCFKVVLH